MKRIAIIGAGLSGLVLARRIGAAAEVTIFEKSRGVGGRMATRYAGDYEFDHGAQFFTARTRAFRDFLRPLVEDEVIANWTASFAELDRARTRDARDWGIDYPHYVGTPRMNAVGKYLSRDLDVRTGTRIVEVNRKDRHWTLSDAAGSSCGGFDWLVITAPAPQTAELAREFPELVELGSQREMRACFALMLGFQTPLDLAWQAALVRNADISWISVNSSKPGREPPFTLLVHSTNAWASKHLEDKVDAVRAHMLDEASTVTGCDLQMADFIDLHRWRYANMDKQHGPSFYLDEDAMLAACGDWFVRGRIEAAFTSASALAERLLDRL